MKLPIQARVIIVPPNRSDELNQKEAKELLQDGGYPANPNPWIAAIEGTEEAYVLVVDDVGELIRNASNGKPVGDR